MPPIPPQWHARAHWLAAHLCSTGCVSRAPVAGSNHCLCLLKWTTFGIHQGEKKGSLYDARVCSERERRGAWMLAYSHTHRLDCKLLVLLFFPSFPHAQRRVSRESFFNRKECFFFSSSFQHISSLYIPQFVHTIFHIMSTPNSTNGNRIIPLTCSGHTRPVVDIQFSSITPQGKYYLISACKGKTTGAAAD